MSLIVAYQAGNPVWQVIDENGPVNGALIWTWAAGTTTPLGTYTDYTGVTPAANPIVCDSLGRASVWFANQAYKVIITSADGAFDIYGVQTQGSTIWTEDGVTGNGFVQGTTLLQSFDTIAYLYNELQPASNSFVEVLGYNTVNDGGGGMFYWSAASTDTDDAGMTIKPTYITTGRYKRIVDPNSDINVLWFGAQPNNSYDNKAIFVKANTYANSRAKKPAILLPAGEWTIKTDPAFTVPIHFEYNAILKIAPVSGALNPVIIPIIDDVPGLNYHFNCAIGNEPVFPAGTVLRPSWFANFIMGTGDTNDDTPAFIKAVASIAAGGTLLIASSPTYYSIQTQGSNTDPIIPLGSNITIQGEGDGGRTIMRVKADAAGPIYYGSSGGVFGCTTHQYSIVIDNVSINAQSATACRGINLDAADSEIRNCKFMNFVWESLFIGGLYFDPALYTFNVRIHDNSFITCGSATNGYIKVVSGTRIYINNNTIVDSSSQALTGIQLYRISTDPIISEIYIRSNDLAGCNIATTGASSVEIMDNRIDLSVYPGYANPVAIYAYNNSDDIEIDANTIFTNTANHGIYISANDATVGNYTVANNLVYLIQTAIQASIYGAIAIESAQYFNVVVTNNVLKNYNTTLTNAKVFGVYEYGASWGTNTVTYGANNILGFAIIAGVSGQIYTSVTRTVDLPTNVNIPGDLTVGGSLLFAPYKYINGFGMSIVSTYLNVAAGSCSGSDGTIIKLSSTIIKGITTGVAPAGYVPYAKVVTPSTMSGGVPQTIGAVANQWLHVYVFKGSAGTVDVGVDTIASGEPTNLKNAFNNLIGNTETFASYRRIGAIRNYWSTTLSLYQIRPIFQLGDLFYLSNQFAATDTIALTYVHPTHQTGINLPIPSLPPGIDVDADFQCQFAMTNGTAEQMIICQASDFPAAPLTWTGIYPTMKWFSSVQDLGIARAKVKTILASGIPNIGVQISGNSTAGTAHISAVSYRDFRGQD